MTDEYIHQSRIPKFSEVQRKMMILKGLVFLPLNYAKMMILQKDTYDLHCESITGTKKLYWSAPIDLSVFKSIKNTFNVTVTDVLFGCLAVAFNDYFSEICSSVPKNICVLIPADTRSRLDEPKRFKNNTTALVMHIPTNISDPFNAIREVNARTSSFKLSGEPFSIEIGWKLAPYILPKQLAKYFVFDIVDKTSAIVSSLIGPQQPIIIDGHTVDLLTYWPPQANNQGIGISFCSYDGFVRLGIMSDMAVINDPNILGKKFERSLVKVVQAIYDREVNVTS